MAAGLSTPIIGERPSSGVVSPEISDAARWSDATEGARGLDTGAVDCVCGTGIVARRGTDTLDCDCGTETFVVVRGTDTLDCARGADTLAARGIDVLD